MTATDFDFEEVDIPTRPSGPGRPADFNPFVSKVAELVDSDGTPRKVAVSFTLADTPDSVAANRIKRQLARAGIVHGVSVFKTIEDSSEGSLVTFWAQSRIVPQRRPKVAEGAEDAPEAPDASDGVTRLEP